MKRFVSIVAVVFITMMLSVTAFATFEEVFSDQMPTFSFDSTDFEVGRTYVLHIDAPRDSGSHNVDGGDFRGIRAVITDVKDVNGNITIQKYNNSKFKEDDNYNFDITFSPNNTGKLQLEVTLTTYGYDYSISDYRLMKGKEWSYLITTEEYEIKPSSGPIETSSSSESETENPGTTNNSKNPNESNESKDNTENNSGITDNDGAKGGTSVWIWIILGVVVIACAAVGVVLYKKKLKK